MASSCTRFLSILAILLSSQLAIAQNSTVLFHSGLPLSWTNDDSSWNVRTYTFADGRLIRIILLARGTPEVYGDSLSFGLGFVCDTQLVPRCYLSVVLLECSIDGVVQTDRSPELVWTANRDSSVERSAVLHADPDRGIVLTSSNGFEAFSTKISGGSAAAGMTLTSDGDLLLINSSDSVIWGSSNYPTDTLLLGQGLAEGSVLTSSRVSNVGTDDTDTEDVHRTGGTAMFFSLSVGSSSLTAFVTHNKPVVYLSLKPDGLVANSSILRRVTFTSTNITFTYEQGSRRYNLYSPTAVPSPIQLLRLDEDGGVRIYFWEANSGWRGASSESLGYEQCQLPMACGRYGFCTQGGCVCPNSDDGLAHLTPVAPTTPNQGCSISDASPSPVNPIRFTKCGNVSYFGYSDRTAVADGITELEACTERCIISLSCGAAFFTYDDNASDGRCYLPSEVLTIRAVAIEGDRKNSAAYLKLPSSSTFPRYEATQAASSNALLAAKFVKTFTIIGSIGLCMLTW